MTLKAWSIVALKTRSRNWEACWTSDACGRVTRLNAMLLVVRDHQVIDSFVLGTGVAAEQLTRWALVCRRHRAVVAEGRLGYLAAIVRLLPDVLVEIDGAHGHTITRLHVTPLARLRSLKLVESLPQHFVWLHLILSWLVDHRLFVDRATQSLYRRLIQLPHLLFLYQLDRECLRFGLRYVL